MKNKKQITIFLVLFVCAAAYSAWWYYYKFPIVEIFWNDEDCVWAAAERIGRRGGENAIIPMIRALRKANQNNGLSTNLVKLNERHRIDREPYLSELIKSINDPKTHSENKWLLMDVLQEVTGRNFHLPELSSGIFVGKRKESLNKSEKEVRLWWEEYKNKEGKETRKRSR